MIQGGCPNGTGMGGPGYCIKGEFALNGVENPLSHTRGVLSMARAQPLDSAGSQFFIMHQDGAFSRRPVCRLRQSDRWYGRSRRDRIVQDGPQRPAVAAAKNQIHHRGY